MAGFPELWRLATPCWNGNTEGSRFGTLNVAHMKPNILGYPLINSEQLHM